MQNILIVDDEAFVRTSIMESINWEENGLHAICAPNGKEALNVIATEQIDVLLTDIKMPVMNGMDLISNIRQNDTDIEIIILSCFNEFDLVRKAMNLGACDYLLKPTMLPEDILFSVLKASKKIAARREEQSTGRHPHANSKKIKETLLFDILDGRQYDRADLEEQLKRAGAQIGRENLTVAVLKAVEYQNCYQETYSEDIYLFKYSIQNILKEIMDQSFMNELVCVGIDEYVVILTIPVSYSPDETEKALRKMFQAVFLSIKQWMGFSFVVGVSLFSYQDTDLHTAFLEADAAAHKEMYQKGGGNISFSSDFAQNAFADEDVKKAIRFIHAHIDDKNLSLQTTADHIKLSKNYLSRIFKQSFGVNFIDYVTMQKMERAKSLYINTNMRIYEIAEMVGYSDWRYFYNVYKKHMGHSLSNEKRAAKSNR